MLSGESGVKVEFSSSTLTWHQRCAPCMGHTHEICLSSWTPSSRSPLPLVENLLCNPRLHNPPLE